MNCAAALRNVPGTSRENECDKFSTEASSNSEMGRGSEHQEELTDILLGMHPQVVIKPLEIDKKDTGDFSVSVIGKRIRKQPETLHGTWEGFSVRTFFMESSIFILYRLKMCPYKAVSLADQERRLKS